MLNAYIDTCAGFQLKAETTTWLLPQCFALLGRLNFDGLHFRELETIA